MAMSQPSARIPGADGRHLEPGDVIGEFGRQRRDEAGLVDPGRTRRYCVGVSEPGRYFTYAPFIEGGKTCVLTKM